MQLDQTHARTCRGKGTCPLMKPIAIRQVLQSQQLGQLGRAAWRASIAKPEGLRVAWLLRLPESLVEAQLGSCSSHDLTRQPSPCGRAAGSRIDIVIVTLVCGEPLPQPTRLLHTMSISISPSGCTRADARPYAVQFLFDESSAPFLFLRRSQLARRHSNEQSEAMYVTSVKQASPV